MHSCAVPVKVWPHPLSSYLRPSLSCFGDLTTSQACVHFFWETNYAPTLTPSWYQASVFSFSHHEMPGGNLNFLGSIALIVRQLQLLSQPKQCICVGDDVEGWAEKLLKFMAQGHRFFQRLRLHHTTVEHLSLLTLPPCQDSRGDEHSWKKCMKTCLIRSLKSPRK